MSLAGMMSRTTRKLPRYSDHPARLQNHSTRSPSSIPTCHPKPLELHRQHRQESASLTIRAILLIKPSLAIHLQPRLHLDLDLDLDLNLQLHLHWQRRHQPAPPNQLFSHGLNLNPNPNPNLQSSELTLPPQPSSA